MCVNMGSFLRVGFRVVRVVWGGRKIKVIKAPSSRFPQSNLLLLAASRRH